MREFVTNVYSPSWWIGVVLVSFLINLASAYAKPSLDRLWARYSARRRSQLEQNREKLDRQFADIMSTPDGIVLLSVDELRAVLGGVLCFSVCSVLILSLFFLSGSIRILIFGALFVFLFAALVLMHVATKKGDLLQLAKKKRAHPKI
jgi:hypothetical protein